MAEIAGKERIASTLEWGQKKGKALQIKSSQRQDKEGGTHQPKIAGNLP